jgi:GTP cyclohydrolase I
MGERISATQSGLRVDDEGVSMGLEDEFVHLENHIDRPRIEHAVREILLAIGEDPEREGLRGTPRRVAEAYEVLFAGLADDPARHLDVGFQEEHREMVLIRDIPLHSLCEHHLLPFVGKAHVGYIPDGKVVGLSKLARLVEGYARRPQLQERLTTQVADALHHELGALGAIVVIEANHLCMSIRGIQKAGSIAVTSAVRGTYARDERTRQEAMSLITAQR